MLSFDSIRTIQLNMEFILIKMPSNPEQQTIIDFLNGAEKHLTDLQYALKPQSALLRPNTAVKKGYI